MLNISSIGMARDDRDGEAIGELEELRWASVDRAVDVARAYCRRDHRHQGPAADREVGPDPEQCREALRRARQAADAIGKPAMVHVGGRPCRWTRSSAA